MEQKMSNEKMMYRVYSRWTNDEDIVTAEKLCDYGSWTIVETITVT